MRRQGMGHAQAGFPRQRSQPRHLGVDLGQGVPTCPRDADPQDVLLPISRVQAKDAVQVVCDQPDALDLEPVPIKRDEGQAPQAQCLSSVREPVVGSHPVSWAAPVHRPVMQHRPILPFPPPAVNCRFPLPAPTWKDGSPVL